MQSLKCGQCGSPDIEFLPGGFGRCRNCKTTYAPQGAHPAPMPPIPAGPQPAPSYPMPPAQFAPPRKSSPVAAIVVMVVVFLAMAGGAGWFLFAPKVDPSYYSVQESRPSTSTHPLTSKPVKSPGPATPEIKDVVVPPEARCEAELRDVRSATVHEILVYVGRFVNTGETVISRPSVVLSLYDATGKRVIEQAGYASVEWLEPGQWCAIHACVVKPPVHDKAEFRLAKPKPPQYETRPVPAKLVEWGVSKDGFSGDRISGTLRNESDTPLQFVRIIVFGLDAEGLPVGDSYSYATEDEIPPGGESGFQVNVSSLKVGTATRYQVQAVGRAKD